MRVRLFDHGWQVLAVLGAVGGLLMLLAPTTIGQGHDGAREPQPYLAGAALPEGAMSPITTTTPRAAPAVAANTTSTSNTTTSSNLPLFTRQHPLRVLVVGDSLMTYPGYALADQMDLYAGLQVKSVTKQSSGLARPDYYDWPRVLGQTVSEYRPHVVVVLLGANDGQPVRHQGYSAALFTDAWNAEYAKRVEQFIQIATGAGASAIWVGLPIMRDRGFSETEHRLNRFYAAGCAARPGAVYVDGYALFADTQGAYAARLAGASGVTHVMRATDGIHFTMDGAARIAEAVMEVLLRSYRLERAPAPPAQPVAGNG